MNMPRLGGAAALYSTVVDLQRWNEALFGGRILSDVQAMVMTTDISQMPFGEGKVAL
jgi:hypothetical protein